MKASRSDMFSKYPRASSSSVRSSSCMCHQLVSSHDPDASRTRLWAPDLTHPPLDCCFVPADALGTRESSRGSSSRGSTAPLQEASLREVFVWFRSGGRLLLSQQSLLHAGTTRSTSLPVMRHAWCQATDQVRR